jgi:YHS domain-containing protein
VDEARERLVEASGLDHDAPQGPVPPEGSRREVWAARFGSKGGWADAAGYAIADLKMLRKELLLGYGAAGVLAVAVPAHLWSIVFLQGHGWVTSLQNVVVAPLVAVVSCVCSVGNVPLAAALWKGGISFGGVVSFIFADLVSLPLLLVYRRYYGARLALRMLGLFWLVMSAAGLVTEVIFRAAGLVPVSRRYVVAPNRVAWGPTTYLDIASLVLLGVLYWTYCHRDRFGGGVRTALDPVCGMQVARASAPAWLDYEGERVYFCSEHCRHRFEMDPAAADKVERQRSRDRRPI